MKIAVIGAGLIGLTSAYFLSKRGHEIIILERQKGPGEETSFANGSLLTPSMPQPWNAPGCWRVLLSSLVRNDSPLQLHLSTMPSLAGWGFRFLSNSRLFRYEHHTKQNLRLALYSRSVLQRLRKDIDIEFAWRPSGSLRIFRDRRSLANAISVADELRKSGIASTHLSPDEIRSFEPALAPIAHELVGAIRYECDETGDAYQFCEALAQWLENTAVDIRYGMNAEAIEIRSGAVTCVRTSNEDIVADRYVVSAGSYSAPLMSNIGIEIPVRPAKGYSLTLQNYQRSGSLCNPVIDDELHAVVVPVGNALRIAGTAEFAGFDHSLNSARLDSLAQLVHRILPNEVLDLASSRRWCGLRPMSASGVPIIGATSIPNLYINTGHGHLGWTMAAGSGHLLADIITNERPAIDPSPYATYDKKRPSRARFDT